MKFYGNADLQNNEIRQAVMQAETDFPTPAVAGRIIFLQKRVYICAEINSGLPVWIPLTNEINTYMQTVTVATTTWTITHNLQTMAPLVQVYGTDNNMLIPNEITVTDNNTVTITFGAAANGTAVVMFGDIAGAAKPAYAFEWFQNTSSTTWVVTHGLGHYPIVRVYVNNEEVQPASIVHNSINQTTITFSSAQAGYATFL